MELLSPVSHDSLHQSQILENILASILSVSNSFITVPLPSLLLQQLSLPFSCFFHRLLHFHLTYAGFTSLLHNHVSPCLALPLLTPQISSVTCGTQFFCTSDKHPLLTCHCPRTFPSSQQTSRSLVSVSSSFNLYFQKHFAHTMSMLLWIIQDCT